MVILYLVWAAVSLGLARTLRRFSPWAALTLTLLPLAFTGPALLTGRVYAPLDLHYNSEPLVQLRQEYGLSDDWSKTRYDVAFEMIPWRKAVRYAVKNGEWPLLNPFILSGDVLAASAQPAAYHPIHVAAFLLPLGPSLTFVATAVFFTAGLAMFLYCRDIGCRESAALIGAAGWMFCGMVVFWTGWPLTLTLAVFPAMLHAIRRIVWSPGLGATAYLAASLSLTLLAGHPETAFQCIVVGAVYGLLELADARRVRSSTPESRPWRALSTSVGLAFVAGLAALAFSAIDLLPMIEAAPQTYLHSRRAASQVSFSVPWGEALERLRLVWIPYAYGLPWRESTPAASFGAYWYPYAGSVLLAPAIFGLSRSRWPGRWWLLAAAVLGLLLFAAAPGLIDVLDRLPFFEMTINRRFVFVVGFATAALAALGMEHWGRVAGGRRLGWLHASVFVTLALIIGLYWPGLRKQGLSAELLWERTLLELAPIALMTVLVLTSRSVRICTACLLAVLVVQRAVQYGELNPTYPEEVFAPDVKPFEHLPPAEEPYRIVAIGNVLRPNLGALYELEDLRGSSPMTHARLVKTFPLWAEKSFRRGYVPRVYELDRPFLSFLNARYALVDRSRRTPGRRIPAKGIAGWEPRARQGRVVLYENTRVLPRAFVPRHVRFVSPVEKIVPEMREERNFSRLAWIETSEPDAAVPEGEVRNGPGRVRTTRRGLGFDLEVEMTRPGWVVVSQTAWKGWRAFAGGEELQLHYANYAFLAFHLPRGHHSVELFYRPRSFIVGRAITFSAVVLLFCGVIGRLAVNRRPRLPWHQGGES